MSRCDALARIVRLIADARTFTALDSLLAETSASLGFKDAAYYRLAKFGAPVAPTLVFGVGFELWMKIYAENRYEAVDPVIPITFRRDLPFTVSEVEARAPRPVRLHQDRRKYWGPDGLFCPVASSWGETGVVGWACDEEVRLEDHDRLAMGVISQAFVTQFKHLSPGEALPDLLLRPLSRREAECAFWMSRGNRVNEIADILGLSVHTVRQYIDSAVLKLDAKNKGEMLLRAAALGLISDHSPVAAAETAGKRARQS